MSHAPGVPSNTNVSGAGTTTQFPNVSNLIPNHQQGIQGLNQLVPIMPLPTVVLPTEALPTPVKAKSLEVYLTGYQEASRKHLLAGFSLGFRLHFQGPQEGSCSNNLVSASEHADIADQKLAEEIQAGRIIGPFEKPPLHNLKVQGEYRMIHHLSFLFGGSVNDFIPPEFCSVQYAIVDDAVQIV